MHIHAGRLYIVSAVSRVRCLPPCMCMCVISVMIAAWRTGDQGAVDVQTICSGRSPPRGGQAGSGGGAPAEGEKAVGEPALPPPPR